MQGKPRDKGLPVGRAMCDAGGAMKAPRPPLDSATLGEMAAGYAARYATTRQKLARYLAAKVRARGWADDTEPPVAALVERMVAAGAVDDRAWGEAKTGTLSRRGYGAGRVKGALAAGGLVSEMRDELTGGIDARAAAEAYAKRRRLGRFAATERTPEEARRDMGAMQRAGHGFAVARAALAAEVDSDEFG